MCTSAALALLQLGFGHCNEPYEIVATSSSLVRSYGASPGLLRIWGKASAADLAFSCSVDRSARTATVAITNKTHERLYFARSGSLVEYQVIVTTSSGKRLPEPAPVWPNQATAKLKPTTRSTALITLEPKEGYSATFNLAQFSVLPPTRGNLLSGSANVCSTARTSRPSRTRPRSPGANRFRWRFRH